MSPTPIHYYKVWYYKKYNFIDDELEQKYKKVKYFPILYIHKEKRYLALNYSLLDDSDVVTFEQDTSKITGCSSLGVLLTCLVKNKIHVFIKTNDAPFNSGVDLFKNPNADTGSVLKITEDQVNGLNHCLLDLCVFVCHGR